MSYRVEHLRAGAVRPWGRVESPSVESVKAVAPPCYRRAVDRLDARHSPWRDKYAPAAPLRLYLKDWRGRDMGVVFFVWEGEGVQP